MNSLGLLPCPFCGTATDPVSFGRTGYGVGASLWHIRCSSSECFAIGPVAPTVAEARGRWNRCNSEFAFTRATVAEALAALRIEWTHQKAHYDNSQDDIFWERGQELETRLRELDATIAKLGLAEETK